MILATVQCPPHRQIDHGLKEDIIDLNGSMKYYETMHEHLNISGPHT